VHLSKACKCLYEMGFTRRGFGAALMRIKHLLAPNHDELPAQPGITANTTTE